MWAEVVVMPDATLACAVGHGYPVTAVRMSGQLDMATAVQVRTTLLKVLAGQPKAVLVDLADLEVVDDLAVLAFLTVARHAAAWPGCQIVLYGASAETQHAFDRMAITRLLAVCQDRTEALARLSVDAPVLSRFTERLPPVPEAAGLARRMVVEACQRWGVARLVESAEIVVTELVSNAVRHGRPPIELSLERRGRYLHIRVRDRSPVRPSRLTPTEHSERGRGLLIVDAFATSWGSDLNADGKVVWATLRVYPR
jgi:anti-anti-sigma regulatory factor